MSKHLKEIAAFRVKAKNTSSELDVYDRLNEARELIRASGDTPTTLLRSASKGGIVAAKWGTGTRSLHHASFVAPAVAGLTTTKTIRGRDKHDDDVLVVIGFSPDAEIALGLLDACLQGMEAEWDSFRDTTAYQSYPRSARSTLRNEFMRDLAERIRTHVNDATAEESRQRLLSGTDATTINTKRSLVSAAAVTYAPKAQKKGPGRPPTQRISDRVH